MKKLVQVTLVVSLCSLMFAADEPAKESKATDRVQASADVLNEIESAPDSGIPQEILGRAECVALDAERRLCCRSKIWARPGELPDAEGLELPGFFHRKGRELRLSDRRASSRLGHADHE
jgi:hypothetical protein